MDWDDQVAAIGGAWNEGAWWEAPGGEESRGGGQGKGGKWRTPGTLGFLKNHSNMLTHMAERGAIQLEQAESAFQQARRDFEQAKTQENPTRLGEAADWVRNRSQNVDRIAHKWRILDEEHLYMFTEVVVPLTERETVESHHSAEVGNCISCPRTTCAKQSSASAKENRSCTATATNSSCHARAIPPPPQRVGQSQSQSCTAKATTPSCRARPASAKGKAAARQDACRPRSPVRSPRRSAVGAREKREAQQGATGPEGSERTASRPRPANWNDV